MILTSENLFNIKILTIDKFINKKSKTLYNKRLKLNINRQIEKYIGWSKTSLNNILIRVSIRHTLK